MVTDLLRSRSPAGAAVPTGLYVARRGGAEVFLPAAAPPVILTAPGILANWGVFVNIGMPALDFMLSQIHFIPNPVPAALSCFVVELWEQAFFTLRDCVRFNCATSDPTADAQAYVPAPHTCRPTVVPAGRMISARMAVSMATPQTGAVYIAGWLGALPPWNTLPANTVAGAGRYYPSDNAALGLNVLTGAGWAYGASATVVDPAPNDMLVHEVLPAYGGVPFANSASLVQVGFGPAGAETWAATVLTGRMASSPLIHPPVWVEAGERLAIRAAGSAAVNRGYFVKVYDF